MKTKEINFNTRKEAVAFQKEFKKKYGYRPSLFIFPEENRWMIVKPKGLKRIK